MLVHQLYAFVIFIFAYTLKAFRHGTLASREKFHFISSTLTLTLINHREVAFDFTRYHDYAPHLSHPKRVVSCWHCHVCKCFGERFSSIHQNVEFLKSQMYTTRPLAVITVQTDELTAVIIKPSVSLSRVMSLVSAKKRFESVIDSKKGVQYT